MPAQAAPGQALVGPPRRMAKYLAGLNTVESKETALSGALALWGTSLPIREYNDKELVDPETYFNLTATRNGFLVYRMQCNLTDITKLNLPAIFEFRIDNLLEPHFLTLIRINDRRLTFLTDTSGEQLEVSPDALDGVWTGLAYIPWTNFFEYVGVTPISGKEQGIRTLKQILEKIGYGHLSPEPVYDSETQSAVEEIQLRYGIPVDGLVGPLTKMALYNELPELGIPHIRKNGDSPQQTDGTTEPKVID
jgi:general secretion pathway protein A